MEKLGKSYTNMLTTVGWHLGPHIYIYQASGWKLNLDVCIWNHEPFLFFFLLLLEYSQR